MAKETVNRKYGAGEAYINEAGHVILNEIKKEEVTPYDLTQIVNELNGAENVTVTLSFTKEIESNTEE